MVCYRCSGPYHLARNCLQGCVKETIDQPYQLHQRIQYFQCNKAKHIATVSGKHLRREVININLLSREVKNETLPTTDIISEWKEEQPYQNLMEIHLLTNHLQIKQLYQVVSLSPAVRELIQ